MRFDWGGLGVSFFMFGHGGLRGGEMVAGCVEGDILDVRGGNYARPACLSTTCMYIQCLCVALSERYLFTAI